jgi:hypothetical protein
MLAFARRPRNAATTAVLLTLCLGLDPWIAARAGAVFGALAFDDAQLTYSTTFGRGQAMVREIAVDGDGNIIIAGNTGERFLFPLIHAADTTYGDNGTEPFVAKIGVSGDELVYSTYLGGDGDDWISGLAVDAAGNAYVTGTTVAMDFPTKDGLQPTPNVSSLGDVRDAFVAKLDPTGTLVWSTYLGGEGGDEGNDVAVDAQGNVYVVGDTQSADFPSLNAFQSTCMLSPPPFEKCYDAFITKLASDGSELLFSTFLGGNTGGLVEEACGVDVDGSGNVYVVGETRSDNFPLLSPIQSERGGGTDDMFAAKLSTDGSTLLWSTYLGGSDEDGYCSVLARGPSVAVDAQGDAFLTTFAKSTDLPVVGGFQGAHLGATDGYVAKITSGGQLAWSTYLGGSGSDIAANIGLSPEGAPVVVGFTTSKDFPLSADALAEAGCPLADTPLCASDAFVTALGAGDGALLFSSFLGGDDLDQASAVAVAADDTIVVGGWARSDPWPLVDPLPAEYRGGGITEAFVSSIGSAPPALPGDANGDGLVTASDALLALSAALSAASCELCVCDMNGDGSLTATDALIVLNLAVGLPVEVDTPAC